MHLAGEKVKKSLSERIHYDKSGVVMHRDLMSAFLSRHVYDDSLSLRDARLEYSGMETTLLWAWQQYQQSANQVSASESQCSHSPVELIRSNLEKPSQIAFFGTSEKLGEGSEESPDYASLKSGEVSTKVILA